MLAARLAFRRAASAARRGVATAGERRAASPLAEVLESELDSIREAGTFKKEFEITSPQGPVIGEWRGVGGAGRGRALADVAPHPDPPTCAAPTRTPAPAHQPWAADTCSTFAATNTWACPTTPPSSLLRTPRSTATALASRPSASSAAPRRGEVMGLG